MTLSFIGSTLTPSSVTLRPLTRTLPDAINSSALRREATPQLAINFCNRSILYPFLYVLCSILIRRFY